MADTPAPLPSLGLLDGLGSAGSGNTDSPAPFPHLGLLGGLGSGEAVVEEPPLPWLDDRIPGAWYVDPGFAAAYVWQQQGIAVANRDEVSEEPMAQGGDPAPLPHLGLLLTPGAEPPAPSPPPAPDLSAAGRARRRRRYVVEIDNQEFVVDSPDAALELLAKAKAEAEELAAKAVKRAGNATRRPARKVIADARRSLLVPQIKAPEGMQDAAQAVADSITETYRQAMQAVEIAAYMAKREAEIEREDEELLLLIL